ncbi:ankyrin repeat domain-containing protein [Ehrlichia ruminantium]|nr:ankyrin repeat domain-containing protein [Ehrlichia ruminantium]
MVRKSILIRYTRPLLFSKIVMCDISFLEIIQSLECKDILLMKDTLGTIYYYLIMSLYDMSGVRSSEFKHAINRQLRQLLLDAVRLPIQDQSQDLASQSIEMKEILSSLKSACRSVYVKLCKTVLDVIPGDDVSKEAVNNGELQEGQLQDKTEMFLAVINAVRMLFNKINTAVKNQEISPEVVSEFLSYSDKPCNPLIPNAISALGHLYFLIDNPALRDLSYLLVKTFLVNSVQYTLDDQGRTALHYAVNISNQRDQDKFLSDVIESIVFQCPDIVHKLDKSGNNVMHYVTSAPYMNVKIAEYFSEHFPDMNKQQNIHGDTPLHIMAAVNFVFFAKVFSFFSLARMSNMKKLRDCLNGMSLSNMRVNVASLRERGTVLSFQTNNYVSECVKYCQYLLTRLPLYYMLEVKNKFGLTIYDILKHSVLHISRGRLDLLLKNFVRVSAKLPVYDDRINMQYEKCVRLYFSGGHNRIVTKKTFERSFYLYTKYAYELLSNEFDKVSHHKMEHEDLVDTARHKAIRIQLMSLVIITFVMLTGLSGLVSYMYNNTYESVLCGVVSINIFTMVCIFYVLYSKYISRDDAKLAKQEVQEIKDIWLSHLDVKGIAIDRENTR